MGRFEMTALTALTALAFFAAVFSAIGCKEPLYVADARLNGAAGGTDSASPSDSDLSRDTQPSSESDDSETASTQQCSEFVAVPGDTVRSISVNGAARTYLLHVPDTYTAEAPVPLLVDFHLIGGDGESERAASPYPEVTDSEGVIAAFPSGLSGPSGSAWNIGPCCVDGAEDVAFTRAMIADIEGIACIDAARVYAVGISMGGGMVNLLACEATDLFAAVAPAGFDLIEETVSDCTPSRPIAVVSFRGTDDPLVPYEGGYSTVVPDHPITFLGAQKTFAAWAEINSCSGEPSENSAGCQAYSGAQCTDGVEVVLCTAQGGGIEPGDPSVAWPILSDYRLP